MPIPRKASRSSPAFLTLDAACAGSRSRPGRSRAQHHVGHSGAPGIGHNLSPIAAAARRITVAIPKAIAWGIADHVNRRLRIGEDEATLIKTLAKTQAASRRSYTAKPLGNGRSGPTQGAGMRYWLRAT